MPRIKKKTKAEDLARVRNNQRRCRQRKRDYVAELERELASNKDASSREILRLQSITDGLRQENERLTALLELRGVGPKGSSSRPSRPSEYENTVLSDNYKYPVPSVDGCGLGAPATPPGNAFQLCLSPIKSSSVERFEDTFTDSNCLPIPPKVEPNSGSLSLRETHVLEANIKPEMSKNNYEDTTVCAVALELAMNCNTKNLSIMELDLRLRCGYRSARFQWEGCRVDNQVLFEVLTEIM
ncbi:hypothetical protein M752DRAFT_276263 [Aspergillus phoenicis ATCC 13157]|uniref:BZIP domain-containing protein n=1 Tax=Aspergillus phoenicis ATCC 13157 TaxID=1353007 RepID=A0A370PJD1_ASPPH|nr:hypothetical protein M752DRAFT_276263 [Aspergillus phoenicis ATCC 13157]